MPPKDLLQGPSGQMEKSVLWLAELSARQGNAGGLGGAVPPWLICPTQLGVCQEWFLSISIICRPLSAMAAWDNGAHICLCQAAHSRQKLGAGQGDKGHGGWVSPAGCSPDWGYLTRGSLCVLYLQPPGAQRNQVHSPRSLLSLQKAAEDVSASHCFLRVSRGGRETPDPRPSRPQPWAGPASPYEQAAAWCSCP